MVGWISTKERLPEKDGLYLILWGDEWETFVGVQKYCIGTAQFLNNPEKTISEWCYNDGSSGNFWYEGENIPCFITSIDDELSLSWYGFTNMDMDSVLYWAPIPELPN